MQDQENRGIIPELIGLPTDVKQYPLEHGWLVVSTVGMCFIPFPVAPTQKENNEQTREAQTIAPKKQMEQKYGKR